MSEVLTVLRALIRDELRMLRLGEIGVVTSIFPHKAGDDHNHECNVRLRESEVELRQVPICTPHVGMVSAPEEGDLVLITYVDGDANRPVVVGRLYSKDRRPPEHEAGEWHVESPLDAKTSLTIDKDGAIRAKAGSTSLVLHADGSVELEGPEDLAVKVNGSATVKCSDATIDASGNIALGQGGSGVITVMSHKCYFTGAPLVGSVTVSAKL